MISEFNKAVSNLTSQGKFRINLGLERVQKYLEIINNPQNNLKFIHVAGTNGKGSVCSILSSILSQKQGFKVGLFTSPHVFEYTERIQINNKKIEKEVFAKKIFETIEIAEKNDIPLTEFEILTVLAFDYFAQNNVDIVILETGLGGRFDATNIIKQNICSIITHIDLDHTERLGDTIEKIAFEKSGIIKGNCPVITNADNAGFDVIKKTAEEKNAELIVAKEAPTQLLKELSLKGKWQSENLGLALTAIEHLKETGMTISEKELVKGLKSVNHPCRFQYIKEKNLLIDGAHNPNGTKALRESLDKDFGNKKLRFVYGCLKNKDYKKMMEYLFKEGDEIYFYHFDNENSCTVEGLQSACKLKSKSFEESKDEFLSKDENTLTVICGSFYMLKELLEKIGLK